MGKSIRGALSYNEDKVSQRKANLILASGFACDVDSLGFTQKFQRFSTLIENGDWGKKTNTLHLSLNFSPDETLSIEKMQTIARDYMERIGFSEQPYLAYQHLDAKHPHIHIVTTNVRESGRPINFHNIGKNKSEPARKAIEIDYGLIQAESRKVNNEAVISALELLPAIYSKQDTKHTITNIVGEVMRSYKFSDLEEFNAILRDFNITADRGRPGSKTYSNEGLVYSILDQYGGRIGQPIKASDIYGEPTLKNLEIKFTQNKVKKIGVREKSQKGLIDSINFAKNGNQLINNLLRRKQSLQFLQGLPNQIKQAFLIDHRYKAAFNVEELNYPLQDLLSKLQIPINHNHQQAALSWPFYKNKLILQRKYRSIRYRVPQPYQMIIRILFNPIKYKTGGSGPIPKRKKKKRRPDY